MKKFYILLGYFFIIIFIGTFVIYQSYKSNNYEQLKIKNKFVEITQLPDLSLSTEAPFIRHRSLANINSVFFAGPETGVLFPSDFVYQPSKCTNNTVCKIKR